MKFERTSDETEIEKVLASDIKSESEFVDLKELAKMLSVSESFIKKHCRYIAGAVKVGRIWRFNVAEIRIRAATGKNIITRTNIRTRN